MALRGEGWIEGKNRGEEMCKFVCAIQTPFLLHGPCVLIALDYIRRTGDEGS